MLTAEHIPEIRRTMVALCNAEERLPPCLTDAQIMGLIGVRNDEPQNRESHKALIVATLDRMARRVGFDVRKAAEKPAKFLAWLDGNAKEHRVIFDEAMRPVVKAYASVFGGDVTALCAKADAEFFDGLLKELNELTQPPHGSKDLPDNVGKAMDFFERFAGERVMGAILESKC